MKKTEVIVVSAVSILGVLFLWWLAQHQLFFARDLCRKGSIDNPNFNYYACVKHELFVWHPVWNLSKEARPNIFPYTPSADSSLTIPSGWKEYRGSDLNSTFTFWYPSDWTYEKASTFVRVVNIDANVPLESQVPVILRTGFLNVPTATDSNLVQTKFVDTETTLGYFASYQTLGSENSGPVKLVSTVEANFQSKNEVSFTQSGDATHQYKTLVWFTANSFQPDYNETAFKQIVSTFRFSS